VHTEGKFAHGIDVFQSTSVILSGNASIETFGDNSSGIYSKNGFGNVITVNSSNIVSAEGASAAAVKFVNGPNALINYRLLQSKVFVGVLGDDMAGNTDTVENYGTIIGGNGTAIDLRAGDDTLSLGTGSVINGTCPSSEYLRLQRP